MALCPGCRTVIPCHCHLTPPVEIQPGVYANPTDHPHPKGPDHMTDAHPTVQHTDELRAAAEALRDLGTDSIERSDDPLTVFRNLYATLDALADSWPALANAAGFRDFFEESDLSFMQDIEDGLRSAAAGLARAQDSI